MQINAVCAGIIILAVTGGCDFSIEDRRSGEGTGDDALEPEAEFTEELLREKHPAVDAVAVEETPDAESDRGELPDAESTGDGNSDRDESGTGEETGEETGESDDESEAEETGGDEGSEETGAETGDTESEETGEAEETDTGESEETGGDEIPEGEWPNCDRDPHDTQHCRVWPTDTEPCDPGSHGCEGAGPQGDHCDQSTFRDRRHGFYIQPADSKYVCWHGEALRSCLITSLRSQWRIDELAKLGCQHLYPRPDLGVLNISLSYSDTGDHIVSLKGFETVRVIEAVNFRVTGTRLASLEGFRNVEFIGWQDVAGMIVISGNPLLAEILPGFEAAFVQGSHVRVTDNEVLSADEANDFFELLSFNGFDGETVFE